METSLENLSTSEKAAAAAGLNAIGEKGNKNAGNLARSLLNESLGEKSPYVYKKLKGETSGYVPLKLAAQAAGYRYVYSDSKKEITLTKNGKTCRFVVSSDVMKKQDGTEVSLKSQVKMQDELPYISAEDAEAELGCSSEYIDATDYGICLDGAMKRQMDNLIHAWEEGV